MTWLRIVILLCCAIEAGWMAFDGTRALVVGDYITPKSGPHAGQIGPWQHVVRAVGINPRGRPMMAFFSLYGLVWLGIAVAFGLGRPWAPNAMLVAAVGALWFLPIGTVLSIAQIALLIAARRA
jgi:hypothetical protein